MISVVATRFFRVEPFGPRGFVRREPELKLRAAVYPYGEAAGETSLFRTPRPIKFGFAPDETHRAPLAGPPRYRVAALAIALLAV